MIQLELGTFGTVRIMVLLMQDFLREQYHQILMLYANV